MSESKLHRYFLSGNIGYGARLLAPLFTRPIAWRVLDSLIAMVMFGLAIALLMG